MACFGGFLMGREAAKAMLPRGRGTIIFTGATASLRGREGFAPSPAPSTRCARWRRAWRANWAAGHPRRAPGDRRRDRHRVHPQQLPRALRAQGRRAASSIRITSPTPTGSCTASRATPGRTSWTCVPGWRTGDERGPRRRVPVRFRQPERVPVATRSSRRSRRAPAPLRLRAGAAGRAVQAEPTTARRSKPSPTFPNKRAYDRLEMRAFRRQARAAARSG